MAYVSDGNPAPVTLDNRRLSMQILNAGYDDDDSATIVSDAKTAGYNKDTIQNTIGQMGGIIGGINS